MGLDRGGWIALMVMVVVVVLLTCIYRKLYYVPRPSPRQEDRDIELGDTYVEPVTTPHLHFPSFSPAINSGAAVASASGYVGPVAHGSGGQGGQVSGVTGQTN